MTESLEVTDALDGSAVHLTARFRENHEEPEQALITLGDRRSPYVLVMFQSCPDGNGIMDIEVDTTGFDPEKLIGFLEELAHKMKTEPAIERLPDGTVRDAPWIKPETAEK